jgi:hypothetical protein
VISLLGLPGCGVLIANRPTPLPRQTGLLLLGVCALALVFFLNNPS